MTAGVAARQNEIHPLAKENDSPRVCNEIYKKFLTSSCRGTLLPFFGDLFLSNFSCQLGTQGDSLRQTLRLRPRREAATLRPPSSAPSSDKPSSNEPTNNKQG